MKIGTFFVESWTFTFTFYGNKFLRSGININIRSPEIQTWAY